MSGDPAIFLDFATLAPDVTAVDRLPETCPVHGGELLIGYGLAGGGIGVYAMCDTDGCSFFAKELDRPEASA